MIKFEIGQVFGQSVHIIENTSHTEAMAEVALFLYKQDRMNIWVVNEFDAKGKFVQFHRSDKWMLTNLTHLRSWKLVEEALRQMQTWDMTTSGWLDGSDGSLNLEEDPIYALYPDEVARVIALLQNALENKTNEVQI